MKSVPARLATAAVSALVFAVAGATIPVYADANPNNEGHHYGQLKHPKTHPVPSPLPVPSPAPTPNPPVTIVPVTVPAPIVPAIQPVTAHGRTGSEAVSQIPVTGLAPVADPKAGSLRTAPARPMPGDPLWWLVLLILPALLATWVMAFRGIAARTAARWVSSASSPQPVAELIPSPQP